MFPFLFIYPGALGDSAIFNFEDLAFTCSILGPVFILSASYKKSFLYFITSVKCKISAIILNLIISPIFRFFLLLTVTLLIQWLFLFDPVYCAENTMDNIATTSKSIESTTPSVAETFTGNNHATITDPVNGNNESTTGKLLSKGAGALTETAIENMPWSKILGGYATTKTVVEIFKSTPGPVRVKAAAAVGVGLTTGAFVYSQGGGVAPPNAIMSNVPNSTSPDTANPFIHCPLEEGDNTFSIIDAGGIYKSLLQWLKSNSSDRFPSDTSVDMIDYMSSAAFFTNYNLIVYIMYTVGYYFLFVGFILFSLNYFSKKMESSLGGEARKKVSSKTVESITWLVGYTISISKVMLIFLFTILLVCSTLLYFNYNISSDVANHFVTNLKELYNEPTKVTIEYLYLDVPVEIFQKASIGLIAFFIGLYRSSLMFKLLKGHPFIQLALVLAIVSCMRNISCYIIDITTVKKPTVLQMFTNYNMCSKLVFYSLIFILIFFTIVYIISIIKKEVPIFELILSDKKNVDDSNYNKYLFFNILIIVAKVAVSVAFVVAFQGFLYLFSHYISSDLLHLFY